MTTRSDVNAALGVPALKPRGTTGYSQEVVDLNGSGLQRRSRTSPKGKTTDRYTVEVISEPLLHVFDDQLLGERPANAIAEVIRRKIRDISAVAKPSTLAFRRKAKEAYQRGEQWARDRYSKGRLQGDFTPGKTVRLFNDSGRLATGIHVRENRAEKNWTVNVPANRFDPRTFSGGEAEMVAMVNRLQELVPELGDPAALGRHQSVQDSIRLSLRDMIKKAEAVNLEKRRELLRAVASLIPGGSALSSLFL